MQKIRNRSEASTAVNVRHTGRTQMAFPEIVTFDVLGTMLDEDLVTRLRALEDDKARAYNSGYDVRPWEEELAYVRREQQIRRCRRDAHADYVRRSENEFNMSEVGLPAGDFDNMAYVYAATGGRPRWS